MDSLRAPILWIFAFITLMTVGTGFLIYFAYANPDFARTLQPEVLMSVVIVLAIVILMALLFAIAAGFAALKLTNPTQALGLPEGSIRAMIALILIMVFIIFGVYLFRSVGQGDWEGPSRVQTIDEVVAMGAVSDIRSVNRLMDNGQPYYEIYTRTPVDEDASRLAQQLITTVGTLVVAVAGFYFGSSTFRSGVDTQQGGGATLFPVVQSLTPNEGKQGATVELRVQGQNLQQVKSVLLLRGNAQLANDGAVTASETEVIARIYLNTLPSEESWDLVVENEHRQRGTLINCFKVIPETA